MHFSRRAKLLTPASSSIDVELLIFSCSIPLPGSNLSLAIWPHPQYEQFTTRSGHWTIFRRRRCAACITRFRARALLQPVGAAHVRALQPVQPGHEPPTGAHLARSTSAARRGSGSALSTRPRGHRGSEGVRRTASRP